ncbi:MAG: retropepsin-like aspartic protease [Betaproteobacteria bacterium]
MLLALVAGAQAQSVAFSGMLGDRALLVIDGQPRSLAVGASTQGVKLLRLDGNLAQVDINGKAQTLRLGGGAVVAGGAIVGNGSRIVLPAGPGGHFTGIATINGHTVHFVVDTGATTVAIGSDEAARIGLDLGAGTASRAMTANGAVNTRSLTLTSVTIGSVIVSDVPAMVVPQAMPYVLLGNSFLSRFQMRNDNDTLVLEKKN